MARSPARILIVGAVFAVALAAAVPLSFALQQLISRPILQLAEVTKHVSRDHDYSLRAVKRGNDELGALCDGFNSMLAEIQRLRQELATVGGGTAGS